MSLEGAEGRTVDLANALARQAELFTDIPAAVTLEVNSKEDLSGPVIQNISG